VSSENNYRVVAPVAGAGFYDIGGLFLEVRRKPWWIHRLAVRLILGWIWRDAHDEQR